ncbi:unnamed protein product [Rodentolepis nana]|uniref:NR LBD domain-containing protein n=1 Tax=Rodentolepis nana TaxID=102285 RepID=A0A0R3TH17_RODNA|nr:unnamed protein product [Rodentolepis nana]
MDEPVIPPNECMGVGDVMLSCRRFIREFREIHNSIHNFEFDCHQAFQFVTSVTESLDIRAQARAFLLEYKKEIILLAPFTYFVNCALQILPHIQPFESDPVPSRILYNYYNER